MKGNLKQLKFNPENVMNLYESLRKKQLKENGYNQNILIKPNKRFN